MRFQSTAGISYPSTADLTVSPSSLPASGVPSAVISGIPQFEPWITLHFTPSSTQSSPWFMTVTGTTSGIRYLTADFTTPAGHTIQYKCYISDPNDSAVQVVLRPAAAAASSLSCQSSSFDPGFANPDDTPRRVCSQITAGATFTHIGGATANATLRIHGLTFSWYGVTSAGQINVMAQGSYVAQILQNTGGNQVPIQFPRPLIVWIGQQGLIVLNNSVGGQYEVTTYYSLYEL